MAASLNLCANSDVHSILKCCLCEKFLSVPPIYIYIDESGSICGRCKFANRPGNCQLTRQTLYESLAPFLTFPCSNMSYGCKSQLKWGEVEDHENTCVYKKITCPFNNADIFVAIEKCKWTGSGPGLNEHLENCHGDLIQKLPEIDFAEITDNRIYLTRLLKQLMIVTIKLEWDGQFSCFVMVNGTSTDCDGYRYQLEFSDENRKNSVILRRSRLEDAVAFDQNLINLDKALVVEVPVIKSLLKNSRTVVGRFGIIKKSKRETSHDKSINLQQDCIDDNILRELECSVCKNYMVPPIMICSRGHSFCNQCKEQMDECPTCRRPFHEGRNYTLEKLTTCINYPCLYREAGCLVACSSERIKEHEQECSFSGSQCFLPCSAKPVVNIFKHLSEKHGDSLVVPGEVSVLDISEREEETKYYAICFGNDVFRLVVWYDGDIKFSVQQYGVKQSNYTYEIEVVYSAECSQRIILGRECSTLSMDMWDKSVEMSEDMVERFISDDGELIFFKVYLKMAV